MTTAEWTADGLNMLLIALIVCVFVLGVIFIKGVIEEGFIRKRGIWIASIIGFLLVVYLIFHIVADLNLLADLEALSRLKNILPADWTQIFLVLGLVTATGFYTLMAFRQAKASAKMAEEMRKQTIMSSRPWIIQKAIHEDEKQIRPIEDSFNPNYFSHFEIYNQGGGPAIELEISLRDKLDREGTGLRSHRETFLMAGKTLEFYPADVVSLDESKTYYLACEYQSVLSRSLKIWYQTLLPFEPVKSSKDGKIYVKAGELEFNEVPQTKRIDAFGSRSKPK